MNWSGDHPEERKKYGAKIRYRQEEQACELKISDDD
jgi:tRNA U34 2-thiouridine synthase MnmA/TrmU